MALFDKFKRTHYTVIGLADYAKEQPMGPMVAYQVDKRGLIKKDGTVDMVNLLGILDYTVRNVEKARGARSFQVWCGTLVRNTSEEQPVFYDLIKVANIDFATGRFGLGHENFSDINKSGIAFDSKLYSIAKKINYEYK